MNNAREQPLPTFISRRAYVVKFFSGHDSSVLFGHLWKDQCVSVHVYPMISLYPTKTLADKAQSTTKEEEHAFFEELARQHSSTWTQVKSKTGPVY